MTAPRARSPSGCPPARCSRTTRSTSTRGCTCTTARSRSIRTGRRRTPAPASSRTSTRTSATRSARPPTPTCCSSSRRGPARAATRTSTRSQRHREQLLAVDVHLLELQARRAQVGGQALAGELGADLRAQLLAVAEVHGDVERGDRHLLGLPRAPAPLAPLLLPSKNATCSKASRSKSAPSSRL